MVKVWSLDMRDEGWLMVDRGGDKSTPYTVNGDDAPGRVNYRKWK